MFCGKKSFAANATRLAALIVATSLIVLLAACGGTTKSASVAPQPAPPGAPAPSSSPTPTPTPGPTPSPTPSGASDAFLATLFFADGPNNASQGTLTLDSSSNNGAGILHVLPGGIVNSSNFTLRFCPGGSFNNCFGVVAFADPGTGVTVNFTFPRKGTFVGTFDIVPGTDVSAGAMEAWGIGIDNDGSGQSFRSALLPANSGNSGSGTVTLTAQTAHVVLSGALPNHTFNVALCSGSGCPEVIGNATTDAQGNLTADVPLTRLGFEGFFGLTDSAGVEYQSAFRVQ